MSTAAVMVQGLTKRFPLRRSWADILSQPFQRRYTTAIDGIDLNVEPGELFGLLGPNGAGKTTLLKILCTLLVPTAGRVVINGHDVVDAPHLARQVLGYCFDSERSFYYRLTGRQNLSFFGILNNLNAQERMLRIPQVMEIVGLQGVMDQPFMVYSKGTQQKLALARALLTDPRIIVLDEPTKSLDPAAASDFRHFMRNSLVEQMGKTVVLVTHSLEEARDCCDRMVMIAQGKIVCQGNWSKVHECMAANSFLGRSAEGI